MPSSKESAAEEIVIVRRRADAGEEGHHGGVWKIAYADFMTAMMAFFLVMWLINAANTETKASVASYFNPLKLTDSSARKKGLNDGTGQSPAKGANKSSPDKESNRKNLKQENSTKDGESPITMQHLEQPLPSGVQAQRAAAKVHRDVASASSKEAGKAFRDPFNPSSAQLLLAKRHVERGMDVQAGVGSNMLDNTSDAQNIVATNKSEPMKHASEAESKAVARTNTGDTLKNFGSLVHDRLNRTEARQKMSDAGKAADMGKAMAMKADMIHNSVSAAVRQLGIKDGPGIDVAIEGDNIVLSLTDTSTFGMFAIGSAEPNRDLVQLVQRLTPILSAHSAGIVLRGHTDSRPFRADGRNQNWRLAMARAEAAYAILLRAGVDEARFDRIEAYADRKPNIATDTTAAANRRIEIILRSGKQ